MKSNILFIIILSFFSLCPEAEALNGGKGKFYLEVEASGFKGSKAYLARYWDGGTYKMDSAVVSVQGSAVFTNRECLPQGQYLLHIEPDMTFDLLLGEEQGNIRVVVDEADVKNSKVTGSNDTALFWKYLYFLSEKTEEQNSLAGKIDGERLTNKDRADIERRIAEIDNEIKQYVDSQTGLYGNTWFGVFLKGTEEVAVPFADPQSVEEFNRNREYLRMHYLDNIDLSDPRFWHTNYFTSYLDYYMEGIVDQNPDSLATAAGMLVGRASGNEYTFEKMLSRYTNRSLQSNVMGMENVWMHLYEEYIRGKGVSWIDSTNYDTLEKLYQISENCRIGMKARDLELDRLEGGKIRTNSAGKEYTLLYFYNPSCAHCVHEIPLIKEKLYDKYNDRLTVVGIYLDNSTEEWKSFVEKNGMEDWVNCTDKKFVSKYWLYYDTSKTPATYLLDKNKVIIGKMIDSDNIEKILSYHIKD